MRALLAAVLFAESFATVCSEIGDKSSCKAVEWPEACAWSKTRKECRTDCQAFGEKTDCQAAGCFWDPSKKKCKREEDKDSTVSVECTAIDEKKDCKKEAHCSWSSKNKKCKEASEEADSPCSSYGRQKQCEKNDCSWSSKNKKCKSKEARWGAECESFGKKKKDCKRAGCSWNGAENSCTSPSEERECSKIRRQRKCERTADCAWHKNTYQCKSKDFEPMTSTTTSTEYGSPNDFTSTTTTTGGAEMPWPSREAPFVCASGSFLEEAVVDQQCWDVTFERFIPDYESMSACTSKWRNPGEWKDRTCADYMTIYDTLLLQLSMKGWTWVDVRKFTKYRAYGTMDYDSMAAFEAVLTEQFAAKCRGEPERLLSQTKPEVEQTEASLLV